ncbi:aspartate and glycine-rich protein-like [Ammospiza nelsoni]|uniref:aspartate and glycine-rich protein-like n=1 Tax=Ammospiza nelsoni TaxID=2857394 RepID=UPI00286D057E|nr:aspartate and glycine-rich protein-like [Ammospiza nelsoni]
MGTGTAPEDTPSGKPGTESGTGMGTGTAHGDTPPRKTRNGIGYGNGNGNRPRGHAPQKTLNGIGNGNGNRHGDTPTANPERNREQEWEREPPRGHAHCKPGTESEREPPQRTRPLRWPCPRKTRNGIRNGNSPRGHPPSSGSAH